MTLFGNIKASHLFAQDGTKLQQLEEAVWAWVRLYVFIPRVPCYLTPDVCRVSGCYSYVWWWRPCRVHRRSKAWSASVQNTQVEPGSVTTPGTASLIFKQAPRSRDQWASHPVSKSQWPIGLHQTRKTHVTHSQSLVPFTNQMTALALKVC